MFPARSRAGLCEPRFPRCDAQGARTLSGVNGNLVEGCNLRGIGIGTLGTASKQADGPVRYITVLYTTAYTAAADPKCKIDINHSQLACANLSPRRRQAFITDSCTAALAPTGSLIGFLRMGTV